MSTKRTHTQLCWKYAVRAHITDKQVSPCCVTSMLPPMPVKVMMEESCRLERRCLFRKIDAEAQ